MADGDSYGKPEGFGPEIVVPSSIPENQAKTSKFHSHFLYKAVIVAVFLVILPLFPSEAPEFVNQTVFTRSWELLHLLFVGIAVSYGLFSRRNDETGKENNSKFDNAQSFVSRFLQVSSVFDDEAESQYGSDGSKVQTWSNQYYREEPVVVIAQESSVLDEQRGTSSRIREKPLLLPVRSLKSRVSDADVVDSSSISGSLSSSSSNSGSKRFSNNSVKNRNGEFGVLDHLDLEENLKDSVVLRSPIPWRSRSGRMEMKEEFDGPPLYSLPPSMEESEFRRLDARSSRFQMSHSSNLNSATSSPQKLSASPSLSLGKKLSPSPSLSSESQGKSVEDLSRKKIYYKSSPPPAPPPPPPISRQSPLVKSNSSLRNAGTSFEKELRKSFASKPSDLSRSGREDLLRRAISEKEAKPRTQIDSLLTGKSVRTVGVSEPVVVGRKVREIGEDEMNGKVERRSKEVEAALVEKIGRKTVGFGQASVRPEKQSQESLIMMSKPTFSEFQNEVEEFADKFIIESDEESESEDDDNGINLDNGEAASNNGEAASSSVGDGGPDVNKKADEFIAKFREQIRLQRIESIKRSSGQLNRRNSSG